MKTKTRIVYKVIVKDAAGRFRSFIYNYRHSNRQYHLIYKIGQTTHPKVGLLFAFKSLRLARRFAPNKFSTVLKSQAAIARGPKNICYYDDINLFRSFWENPVRGIVSCPLGTVFCKWIKPLKVMEP